MWMLRQAHVRDAALVQRRKPRWSSRSVRSDVLSEVHPRREPFASLVALQGVSEKGDWQWDYENRT